MNDLVIPQSALASIDKPVFITHNEGFIDFNGSHLQGYLNVSYNQLVAMFGKPKQLDDPKVRVQWAIKFSDGTVATIYDWKSSVGLDGYRSWHIGGFNGSAVERLYEIFKTARYL